MDPKYRWGGPWWRRQTLRSFCHQRQPADTRDPEFESWPFSGSVPSQCLHCVLSMLMTSLRHIMVRNSSDCRLSRPQGGAKNWMWGFKAVARAMRFRLKVSPQRVNLYVVEVLAGPHTTVLSVNVKWLAAPKGRAAHGYRKIKLAPPRIRRRSRVRSSYRSKLSLAAREGQYVSDRAP